MSEIKKGGAYSASIKGVGRVESGWLSQTLYEGKRKWVIFFVLFLGVVATGWPFGALGAAYYAPPIFDKDPLSGKAVQDNIYQWNEDKKSFKTFAWVGFALFLALFIAYIVGWIITARRYAFARTIVTDAKKPTKKSKK